MQCLKPMNTKVGSNNDRPSNSPHSDRFNS